MRSCVGVAGFGMSAFVLGGAPWLGSSGFGGVVKVFSTTGGWSGAGHDPTTERSRKR